MSSDRPGSDTPDDKPIQPRRSRRAGRSSDSYDFRDRFGDTGSQPRTEGLREPTGREQYTRPRGRLTVRQLMEQMGVEDSAAASSHTPAHEATPPTAPPIPSRPAPRAAQPTPPPAPKARERAVPPAATPAVTPTPPAQSPPAQTPPTPTTPAPQAEVEATQALPPIAGYEWEPVDLSDETTAARALDESRAQTPAQTPTAPTVEDASVEPPTTQLPTPPRAREATEPTPAPSTRRRPLEPTPDLTGAIKRARAPKESQAALSAGGSARRVTTNVGRVLVAFACGLALVGTGYVWNLNRGWDGAWNVIRALDPNDSNVRNKEAQYGDETYLIVGTDTRSGANAKVGAGEEWEVEGARADTILLVNIPADRSRVVAVSWPRDLAVDRPECENWDNTTKEYSGTLPAATGVKINGVYADGGPACLVKTLTQMSGLNINHFIAMDFAGFEQVVRAIGGVEVCSRVPLFDDQIGYIVKTPGRKTLTPKQSLNYVRARHIALEGNGDYGRIKRQQLFMSSLLRSTLSGDVLANPNKLNSIVKTFIKYSDVDNVDTAALINLAESMQGMDAGRVTFLTIPTSGTSTDGSNNEIPRTEDIDAIFNAVIDDKPLPGERKPAKKSATGASKPSAPKPTPSQMTAQYPSNITARVLNGTGQSGMASDVMNELIRQGVNVSGIGDASEQRADTVVRYGPGEQDSAATIAMLFPGAKIQLDRTVKSGVQVIVGSDFGGVSTMQRLPASGTTLNAAQLPDYVSEANLPNDLAVTNGGDTTCG